MNSTLHTFIESAWPSHPEHSVPLAHPAGVRQHSALSRVVASEQQGHPFSGRMLSAELGRVRVCRIVAGRHEDGRARVHSVHKDTPFYKLVFQLRGSAQLEQGGRRTLLKAGHWSIYDLSRPYSMLNLEALDQLVLLLPRDFRSTRLSRALQALPEEPFAFNGMGRILFDAAQSALEEADFIEAELSESLGETLLELSKLAIIEKFDCRQKFSVQETLRERIEAYILRNLRDQDLTIGRIASAMNCSKRYLHKTFDESGSTVGKFIWDSRLDRCRRDLENPELGSRSITEIAFSWGFVNSAHFSRAFRNRFGTSPRLHRSMVPDLPQHIGPSTRLN